jgi:hypothetical protein
MRHWERLSWFPRISHHSFTGQLRHHRETSYGLLLFLVLAAGAIAASFAWSAQAASDCGTPETTPQCTASYSVYAVVNGPRPTRPAIITSPTTGQSFTVNPITVEGTCPDKALIKVFTNGILVGSVLCQNGRFRIPVDLVIGRNDLTALPYNALDEEGPAGNTVTVTLNQAPGGFGFSTELILQSVNYYRGTEPGLEITWPIEIIGGQAPYAVSVDWGDGTSDLITRLAPGPFTVKHTYKRTGTGYLNSFPLIIRATDAAGHTAYLQLTTIVNDATAGPSQKSTDQPLNNLLLIWPLLIVLLLMIISFWLGERREKRIMRRQLAALA